MKDNVLSLADESKKLIKDFENYLYENYKEKYVNSKCVLDRNLEIITNIEENINNIDFEEATNELTNIISSINDAKDSLNNSNEENIINNADPNTLDENIVKEEALDNTINNLDEALENSSFTPNEETVVNEENDENDGIDESAINAFLNENKLA